MATINASTTLKVKIPKKPTPTPVVGRSSGTTTNKPSLVPGGTKKKTDSTLVSNTRRGSVAPPLKPISLVTAQSIEALKNLDDIGRKERVTELMRKAMGEQSLINKSTPHAASTTRDRAGAAADVAVAAKTLGVPFVLKQCGVLDEMGRMLFPYGVESLLYQNENGGVPTSGGLKPSASAVSLSSMGSFDDNVNNTATTVNSGGTDTKRGKVTPANAREGSLLIIRACCEMLGKACEPFLVGVFLAAALDECGSSSSSIREAAEDAATALVGLAHPWSFPRLICPLLLQALKATEWRVKFNALERLAQCAVTSPTQVSHLLPTLIPALTNEVWDTKAQVTKAAGAAILAVCKTNANADIAPAIPAVVNAICKPADANKAVQELMGTTFVVPVDASTLSILCPVLARALKEKLAIHKRAACLVISNMSRLVQTPEAVAPFGPLLVPELQKVANNVQFEEIRDEALKALANLTKALGDAYEVDEATKAKKMAEEQARVAAEQHRIQAERDAQARRDAEIQKREEEERRRFKEAMDAQRELDKIAEHEAEVKRQEEALKRDQEMRSTKAADGKCQGCGLKKCKKTCFFYAG